MAAKDKREELEDMYNNLQSQEETYIAELTEAFEYIVSGKGRDMIDDLKLSERSGLNTNFILDLSDDLIMDLENFVVIYEPTDVNGPLKEKVYGFAKVDDFQHARELFFTELFTGVDGDYNFVSADVGEKIPRYLIEIFKYENIKSESLYERLSEKVLSQKQANQKRVDEDI